MKITVERRHIWNGRKDDPKYCPVATAMREILKRDLEINGDTCFTEDRKRIDLPNSAKEWIKGFDEGKQMEPITFSVRIGRAPSQVGERA